MATHDHTGEDGADGRGDAGAMGGPQLAAGRIKVEGELLVGQLGVEHERDEAEREHRRRRDEHEDALCGAPQATVLTGRGGGKIITWRASVSQSSLSFLSE